MNYTGIAVSTCLRLQAQCYYNYSEAYQVGAVKTKGNQRFFRYRRIAQMPYFLETFVKILLSK